ncbi:MAG TPA: Asp-tRNA(Asn)/Glu-tRNA(Gln) amidotransferase subunit GatB [Armatimonadota bacterium]|nr:Asp-tRNA(Asn)/Glu-tRNA(Gln) amidotransferase subunit GatB [Armatimonadota bacterium]
MTARETEYELVLGMEVHAELLTESKMFCSCSAAFGGAPNSHCCPVCLGLPGSLPTINRRAVEFVVRTALALNCEISLHSIFYRKNYYYPDLPKGYQISQYGPAAIGTGGYLDIEVGGAVKRVHIRRVHLEEDTGKLFHVPGGKSHVDYNRAGVPLMEIVTETPPDMNSADEARDYLTRLRAILVTLCVCDGKMEEGSMRCEANMSIRPIGSAGLGVKTELKNINSFRTVYRGIEYEFQRQREIVESGGRVVQETRRWDEARGATAPMRAKEVEEEYRYFPEPDLRPLDLDPEWIDEIRRTLPELPAQRKRRYIEQLHLPSYDAGVLTSSPAMSRFFDTAVDLYPEGSKVVSNWLMGDFSRLLNEDGIEINESPVTPSMLVEMIKLIQSGIISSRSGKEVFEEMHRTGQPPDAIVKAKGVTQIGDESAIEALADQILSANPDVVEKFRSGKEGVIGFLVGQLMKASQGRANPEMAQRALRSRLSKD